MIREILDKLFPIRVKKRYYQYQIRKITNSIWDMGLRIATIKEIREGIRFQFDKVSGAIIGIGAEIDKLLEKIGIPAESGANIPKLREELENTKKIVKPEQYAGPDPNLKAKLLKEAVEKTREMRIEWIKSKTLDVQHSEEKKESQKKLEKLTAEILEKIELKQKLEADAESMQKQMMGEWSERFKRFDGGLDHEIKTIEGKIEGGKSFRDLIKRQLKKL